MQPEEFCCCRNKEEPNVSRCRKKTDKPFQIYYLFLKDQYNRINKIKVSQSLYERVKTEGWLQFRYSISKTGYYLKPRYIWVLNEKLE